MYIERTIRKQILHEAAFYPVVVLTGPRQVGKTTVLRRCGRRYAYVSLDLTHHRELARRDPGLFLQRFVPPVLIDEIQYAPELLPHIKAIVDERGEAGLFLLTGSQQFHLMQGVSESLAGRARILQMQGLSQREKHGLPEVLPFLPTQEYLARHSEVAPAGVSEIFSWIWKGSFPKLFTAQDERWAGYYDSYLQTYIERDIRALAAVADELLFLKFLRVIAARTGNLLNYTEVSNEVGVSQPTIKSWVSLLKTSGMIYLLEPYSSNRTKRVIKTPKLYFLDTGLVCYLTGWRTAETAEWGAMNGALFETYIVSEILKSYWNCGLSPLVSFYRDFEGNEVDMLIEENGKIYPIEIKMTSNPGLSSTRGFAPLKKLGHPTLGEGCVLCMAPTYLPIAENITAIPCWML